MIMRKEVHRGRHRRVHRFRNRQILQANDNEVQGYGRFYRPGLREYWEAKGAHTVMGDYAKSEFDGLSTNADHCINLAANVPPANFSIELSDNALGSAPFHAVL